MSENRDDLRPLLDTFLARWNTGDVRGMSACWAETGDVLSRDGRIVRGPEAIAELLGKEWPGPFAGTRASMSNTTVRGLSAGTAGAAGHGGGAALALVDTDMDIAGGRFAEGAPLRQHVVIVASLRDDRWWFEAVRPYALNPQGGR